MAVEDAAPVDASADDASLISEDTPASGAESAAPTNDAGQTPAEESKPGADAKGADESEQSLLDEAKNEDGKTPDKADGKADADGDGAPEAYAAFDLPEGMALDEAALAEATPVLQELKLNQAQAQKLVSLYAGLAAKKAGEAIAQREAAGRTLIADWTKAAKAHQDFGGDKLAEGTGLFNRAIDEFSDTPEDAAALRNFLRETKISNNPQLRAVLCRAAQKLLPDTTVTADAAAQSSKPLSAAERLWPHHFKE